MLQALIDLEVELTGFELAEIDLILGEDRSKRSQTEPDAVDLVPPISAGPAITERWDVWQLGPHRVIRGMRATLRPWPKLLMGDEVDPYTLAPSTSPSGSACKYLPVVGS